MPTTRAASKMEAANFDVVMPDGSSAIESAATAPKENGAASTRPGQATASKPTASNAAVLSSSSGNTEAMKPDGLASLRKPPKPSHTAPSIDRRDATARDSTTSSLTLPKSVKKAFTSDQASKILKNIKGKGKVQKKDKPIPMQHQLEALWHAGLFTVDDAIKYRDFKYPQIGKAAKGQAASVNDGGQDAVTVPLEQQRAVPKRSNAASRQPKAQGFYPRG